MFLMYPDATDKTSNKMEVQTNGSTSKDILVKKQEVGGVENKYSNPLSSLRIRTSNTNSNLGKFGCWRNGGSGCSYPKGNGNKNHHGIDLMATAGTSAFSMYNGKVVEVRNNNFKPRNEQFKNKNLDVNGENTKGINGCHYAEGSFGKQLIVEYEITKGVKGIDGKIYKKIYVLYGHLNTVLKLSGTVKSGEKIAECGCSGNAASLDENDHHIHMEASTSVDDFTLGVKRKIDIEQLILNQK
jgi:murein DD-endopeptidase MepM/ murein hydrolase activator NlpD